MSETLFQLEVRPNMPEKLRGLQDLANDLLYSWDRDVRGLFYRLDDELWETCNHNPKVFLRRIAQNKLDEAIKDHLFMEEYSRVMSSFRTYHEKGVSPEITAHLDSEKDRVAYFCAEFGLHESFPIYSGGLGILAGDHCKAASDLGVPFVGVGLLYRQGYFTQFIDGSGSQLAQYTPTNFDELVVQPACDSDGNEFCVQVEIELRRVKLKVWVASAGHIQLYLLDSDLEVNSAEDRSITFQLYGGDSTTRIQQEIVLGIGGVRALRAMGIEPTIWHINEGHAAFQIPERCREYIDKGMDFNSALELVAAGTVFTTHTPVSAGHDMFDADQMTRYFRNYVKSLNIEPATFLALGDSPNNNGSFNMTALALRGSRYHNGVSRIHGGVASNMEGYVWPQIPANENPISYVTNGVHVPTFLAREWVNLFDMRFREWRSELNKPEYWECIDSIPDHRYWSLRQELKAQMLEDVNKRTRRRFQRAGFSEAQLKRLTSYTSEPEQNVLVLGFARRFATYKRAALLFSDIQRLARLLNNPKRPVMIVFAGKAHPRDNPGQELIRTIHEYSLRPEFIGKIIMLEGYDMALARKLVTGVDVWLNTPEYPLEASGTSGQKAAINGVINLSVLDGWWGEGFDGENGWAIHPHASNADDTLRDQEESADLLDILENEVIPLYYDYGSQGYSSGWVRLSKASMKSCLPRFNAQRMVVDYVKNFYAPARYQYSRLSDDNCAPARKLSEWKAKIRESWKGISIRRVDEVRQQIHDGESLPIIVHARLNGLVAEDVVVECIVGNRDDDGKFVSSEQHQFRHTGLQDDEHVFELNLKPNNPGLNHYKLRIYPWHELLSHSFEMGYMLWI
ncbi:alpha-glucan family phosphorylase [Thiohalophilus sp.]|uniref:alpha-glucan family phosphorylase n=1 Tax=Thiohalophilus sp. TaxID=3028392 RepID=UPI002ACE6041|nr:alpha-glucan family phosphorylase [Thiohalophilus sp.]MDZ7662612.1 alpha-glucan family phosphorylase [Thiohalophilus sp.]